MNTIYNIFFTPNIQKEKQNQILSVSYISSPSSISSISSISSPIKLSKSNSPVVFFIGDYLNEESIVKINNSTNPSTPTTPTTPTTSENKFRRIASSGNIC